MYLSQLERGERRGMSDPVASRLAKVLAIPLNTIRRRISADRLRHLTKQVKVERDRLAAIRGSGR
jgi:hypothetical protein